MLVQTTDFDVAGDMPGQSVDMSLSGDSLEHIMDILSDLYSDRPGAIVREYTTNAIDAHIISGQTRPVEITLPNRLSPNLVIRDYGAGMSKQVLIDTYSKYGASTKRSNNLEAGQLGLGSKSGFAYTDQFTVRSIHEGHCCELIMSRNDRGAAEMTIAFDYASDEESGVTITVPIKSQDVHDVITSVNEFAMFAKPGTISVNGEVNSRPENWELVAENVYLSAGLSTSYVVMGNVAYPVELFGDSPNTYRRYGFTTKRFVCYIGMGEVDFVPSREALKYTNHTKRTVAQIEQYIRDSIEQMILEKAEVAKTWPEKIEVYRLKNSWSDYVSGLQLDDLRNEINDFLEDKVYITASLPWNINDPSDHMRMHNTWSSRKSRLMVDSMGDASRSGFAVADFPGTKVSRDQARKVLEIDGDFKGEMVHFFECSVEDIKAIYPNWTVISWKDAKRVKVARQAKPKKKIRDGDMYLGVMYHNRHADGFPRLMKTNGRSFYVSEGQLSGLSTADMPRGDFKLFKVIPSKQEAFKKANPHAQSLTEYVANRRRQIQKHVESSQRVKECMEYAYPTRNLQNCFDFSKITNEEFRDMLCKAYTGAKWARLSGRFYFNTGEFDRVIQDKYPLLASINSYSVTDLSREHAIEYINMIGEKNVRS